MSPRTKKQFAEIRKDRKSAILKAALELFSSNGYHNSSISQIALHAGISKGLLYNYFDSKETLLRAVLTNLFEKIESSMKIEPHQLLTDRDLIHFINQSFVIINEDRQSWKLYMSMMSNDEVLNISKEQLLPKMAPFMSALIQYFKDKRTDDPLVTLRYFMATLDGAKMQFLFDPDSFPVEEIKVQIKNDFTKNFKSLC